MKNKLSYAIIGFLALWLMALSIYSFTKPAKIAYVETNEILKEYEGAQLAQEQLKEKTQVLQSNLDSLFSEWQNELKDYEKNRSSYSKREKELKQDLLAAKQQQVNQYQQAVQHQIQEEDKKTTQAVFNQINDYLEQYGEKNGYKYILGATGNGNLVYADEAENITEKIIEGLNEQYAGR